MRATLRVPIAAGLALFAGAAAFVFLGGTGRSSGVESPGLGPLFPGFPGAHLYSLGDGMAIDGIPVQIGYFSSGKASLRDISDFYARFWRGRGLAVSERAAGDEAHVAALDDRDHLMRSVDVVRRRDRVVAFASIVPLDGAPKDEASDVPMPAGARVIQELSSSDQGRSESVSYVLSGSITAGRASVLAAWEAQGWKLARDRRPDSHGELMHLERSGKRALVTLVSDGSAPVVGVQVHISDALAGGP